MAKKTVLITGTTRGLGRAMVDEFVRLGHVVLGCGRTKREVDQLRKKYSAPHDFYMVDVSNDEEVKSWASLLLNLHGAPDLVVNNAAIINKNARLWEISAREFAQVIDINLKGTANVIRHFAPEMVRRQARVSLSISVPAGDAAPMRKWLPIAPANGRWRV